MALRRLAAAGVVGRIAPSRGQGGTFGEGGYRISVDVLQGVIVVDPPLAQSAPIRRCRGVVVDQPSLFDLAGGNRT